MIDLGQFTTTDECAQNIKALARVSTDALRAGWISAGCHPDLARRLADEIYRRYVIGFEAGRALGRIEGAQQAMQSHVLDGAPAEGHS